LKAVILAGGKGSRLATRSNGLPKPLVPVNGKPMLEHQLELMARHGVEQVTVLCGYGAALIHEFCGDGSRWGLQLQCLDETLPLGTAGAVIAALDQLPDEFLVTYGDTVLNVDLPRFHAAHVASGAACTLFLHPNDHPHDSDLVESDENGRVLAIHGCPHPEGVALPNQVNAALYVLKASALRGFAIPEKPLDFAKHVFPQLLQQNVHLHGYRSPEYIKDAGTPERLERVENDLRTGVVERSSLAVTRPAVFLDRDGTIIEEVAFLNRPEQVKLLPGVAEAIKMLKAAGYRVAVVTNQPVIARGDCTPLQLLQIHDHLELALSEEGAFLDGIYYCPHHPDKGFEGERPELKIHCECRKPGIGMVRQAVDELNLDLSASWLIGDRTGDVQTGHNCGVRSVLLRTGVGGRDQRYEIAPDFVFDDLLAAARYIAQQKNNCSAKNTAVTER
jgi:histidinol-phosphate phosphatase family protein